MKRFIIPVALALTPALAYAQSLSNLETLLRSIGRLVDVATPIVVGIALLVFFWGLVKFIMSSGDAEKRAEARQYMIWGVVALFVMVAVWGLVNFIGQALNINERGGSVDVPTVNRIR